MTGRLGEVSSFHTAPAPGRGGGFTFTAFGDRGGGGGVYSFPASDCYLGHETGNDKPVPMQICEPDGTEETVEVTWSRVRYTGYCLVAVDVAPATSSTPAQLTVRSLMEDGTAVDQFVVRRTG